MHPWSMINHDHFDIIDPSSREFNTQNLSVRYEIEYQDEQLANWQDENKWDIEPWEYYHKVETDSLGSAFRELIIRMLDDSPTEPKFFMQISNSDGEKIAEAYMDIPYSLRPTLRQMVDENIRKRENSYEAEIEALRKENQLYKEFVEKYHATEQFRKFKEEKYE